MSSRHLSTSSSTTSQTTHVTYSTVTPTSSRPSPNAGVVRALEISLILVAVLLAIISAIFVLHLRRSGSARSRPSTKTDQNAASHVTPFNISPGVSGPRYAHTPGTNMRIATRDLDGSWKIAGPTTPFSPSGVSDVSPSAASSTFLTSTKEYDKKMAAFMKEYDMIPGPEYPPPEYGCSDGSAEVNSGLVSPGI